MFLHKGIRILPPDSAVEKDEYTTLRYRIECRLLRSCFSVAFERFQPLQELNHDFVFGYNLRRPPP